MGAQWNFPSRRFRSRRHLLRHDLLTKRSNISVQATQTDLLFVITGCLVTRFHWVLLCLQETPYISIVFCHHQARDHKNVALRLELFQFRLGSPKQFRNLIALALGLLNQMFGFFSLPMFGRQPTLESVSQIFNIFT